MSDPKCQDAISAAYEAYEATFGGEELITTPNGVSRDRNFPRNAEFLRKLEDRAGENATAESIFDAARALVEEEYPLGINLSISPASGATRDDNFSILSSFNNNLIHQFSRVCSR